MFRKAKNRVALLRKVISKIISQDGPKKNQQKIKKKKKNRVKASQATSRIKL
jgi:hypothetical protein